MHPPRRVLARWLLLAGLLCTAGSSSGETFRAEALRLTARGETDSLTALIAAERLSAEKLVERLLRQRASHSVNAHADSARAALSDARLIARLYATAFGDSLCLRWVNFHERLSAADLATDHRGWERYFAGVSHYTASRYDSAEAQLDLACECAQQVGDRHLEGAALMQLGSCAWQRGYFDRARERYREALVLTRVWGHPIREARLLRNIAATHLFQKQETEARQVLHDVLDAARSAGDWDLYGNALNDLATCNLYAGAVDSAQAQFRRILALARQRDMPRLEANAELNLGLACMHLGDHRTAAEHFERALEIAREVAYARAELGALLNLSSLYADLEWHSRRLVLLRDALRLADEVGAADVGAQIRNEIGDTYSELGRPHEALRYHRDALAVFRELGIARSQAVALHHIGSVHMEMGEIDDALSAFEGELEVVESERLADRAEALIDLAYAHWLDGSLRRSQAYLEEAKVLADSTGNPMLLGNIERALGQVLRSRGERERAEQMLDRAIRRGRDIRAPYVLWRALASKAELLADRGDLTGADALLSEALETIESLRGRLAGDAFRLGFMQDKRGIYASRVAVLCALADSLADSLAVEEALHVAERARARVLLDVLSGDRADPGVDVDPVLREKSLRLRARLGELQSDLSAAVSQGAPGTVTDSLETSWAETSRRYQAVQDEIAARRPAHGTLSGQRAPLRAGEIRSRVLLPGQLLVEYLVGAEHTFLFCLDASHLEVHVIPWGADSIAAEVRALREALLADEPHAAAAQLHALLLGPIEALLEPGSRLLIVPDGPLFYLPFALLHDGERYLIERHALCQAPSASVLDHELWDRSCGGRPKLLAVGNPASFRSQHLLTQTHRATRDWSFGELPFAEEEVRRVAAYFTRDNLLIGAAATEEAVKARMGAVNHLHFATHGMLDEREPLMSALVLAQDEDPREDGFLQVHEILEQSLCADLVVLSACNTGLGKIMTGEGVLGLTHAFMYAGARTLLISLWEVPDQSTAILMDRFYGALSEGLPADEALQTAQRAAIDAGVAPREWAGFALTGYADLRSLAPRGFAGVGRPMRMAALGLSVLLAVLLVALAARRSKRQT